MKKYAHNFNELKALVKESILNEQGNVSYYSSQLQRLNDFTEVNVKFSDYAGNNTNNLNLNDESIDVIIEFLKELKTNPENFNNRKKEGF